MPHVQNAKMQEKNEAHIVRVVHNFREFSASVTPARKYCYYGTCTSVQVHCKWKHTARANFWKRELLTLGLLCFKRECSGGKIEDSAL